MPRRSNTCEEQPFFLLMLPVGRISLCPYLIVFARVRLTDPSQASMRKTCSSVRWTMKGLIRLQKAWFSLAESLATLQQIETVEKAFNGCHCQLANPATAPQTCARPLCPLPLAPVTVFLVQ